jgi:hypothetical protein
MNARIERAMNFENFWSGSRVLAQMTGALANFGNFWGIFEEFLECLKGLGPSRNYFLKLKGVSAKSLGTQGP